MHVRKLTDLLLCNIAFGEQKLEAFTFEIIEFWIPPAVAGDTVTAEVCEGADALKCPKHYCYMREREIRGTGELLDREETVFLQEEEPPQCARRQRQDPCRPRFSVLRHSFSFFFSCT